MLTLLKIILFQLIITIILVILSKKLGMLEMPSHRKIHLHPTPYVGGLTISTTYLFIVFITDFDIPFINLILSYAFLISVTGFIDDKYKVSPSSKIILQFIPVYLLVEQGIFLDTLGNYTFFGSLMLGSFSKIFTILCCILLINAFNYSDGIDGLLAGITIIICTFFGIIFFFENKFLKMEYLFFIIIPLVIFFLFNIGTVKNLKLFLGDSGSNYAGYIIGFLTIYFSKFEGINSSLLIWPLAYVVFEFLTVTIFRILDNKEVFRAGHDHLHYELEKKFKFKLYPILIMIFSINLFFCAFGYFINFIFKPDISIILYIVLFLLYIAFRFKLHRNIDQSKSSSVS
jgi:UDP-GlcNAc:undecaprenyl-phosphate GlcNAc-1-phosphate transferase